MYLYIRMYKVSVLPEKSQRQSVVVVIVKARGSHAARGSRVVIMLRNNKERNFSYNIRLMEYRGLWNVV